MSGVNGVVGPLGQKDRVMTDWKNHFSRPRGQFGFGASAGDVVRYRDMWTPYVRGVVEAARANPDAHSTAKDLAEHIAKGWNFYAGTSPGELLFISDEALKHFQTYAKSSLTLGRNSWMADYPVPDPPSESEQSSVINALEDASLIGRGALEILGAGFTPKGIATGLGAIGDTVGAGVGAFTSGFITGAGKGGGETLTEAFKIPTWVWIVGGAVLAAVVPAVISANPLFRLGRKL